jgi:opacity protein-like surface antigen
LAAIKQTQIKIMKKLLIAAGLTCALALAANAAEGEAKKEGSEHKNSAPGQEQKAIRKELTEKYDTDKSGRLDKEERAKMTPEDAEKWKNAAPPKKEKAPQAPEAKGAEGKKK